MKIHLVDGTYELFRAHYAPGPSRTAPDGADVKAVSGLLSSMTALLREDSVTHVAVAFDTVIESFRNDLFDGYKTGAGIEPDLLAQFPLAEEAASALGLTVWPMREFEADDALATGAARWALDDRVEQIVICSVDKDLAQCVVDRRVVLLDRRRERLYDHEGVREKWGVAPASIPDWLALVGDSADGIPGVPRWGAKSAAALLAAFGRLDAIPDEIAEWPAGIRGAKRLAQSLAEHREAALLYRTLATLRTDVPLTETLDDLEWRGPDSDRLAAICERLGDDRALRAIGDR